MDLFAQKACPAFTLSLSLICLLPFCTICTEASGSLYGLLPSSYASSACPSTCGCCNEIASAVVMGLVPGLHSWVGILACHLLLRS